ncbi:MAG: 50S ribosomal protein L22 [Candidatus Jidaibacter sp.]|jgi:large subunit ribosomal protein L22|nr:50S ribosomal protein L22 [Candidatus Jidaibacter sp.]
MAKESLKFNESRSAEATVKAVKGSVQKINLVCKLISRMKVDQAVLQLKFLRKRVAKDVADVLNSAISNAQNNLGMDVDNLYVSKIMVGKAFALRRFHARGRGRASKITKPFSRITIYVSERE